MKRDLPSAKYSVLIIDDQDNWRELITEILERQFEITWASDFQGALTILQQRRVPFHVVVTDMRLEDKQPGNEDGLKLAEYLHQHGGATGVILITGYSSVATTRRALVDHGAFDYFEKYPTDGSGEFDFRLFQDAVYKAAQKSKTLRTYAAGKQILKFVSVYVRTADGTESILADGKDLIVQKKYTIRLLLQDNFREGAQQVLLHPPSAQGKKIVIDLFLYGKHLKLERGAEVFWQIPIFAIDDARFEFTVIPLFDGQKQLFIELKQDDALIARISRQINVSNE